MAVPKFRFPGFTGDWEQRKLEDHIIEYHEVTTKNNQYPVLTSSRKGIFLQTEYYSGNQVASDDNTGYNIVPYGYFTYRHMSDDEIFHFNINDIVENGIVSTLYPVFTTTDDLDSRYLQYQLNNGHEFAKFAVLQKQGGSRTYMYLNKLKKLYLTMPKTIDEQKKISNYFMQLDNLITLHHRKYDELQDLKKSMIQNMFPKEGKKVPEIRFPGFTGDWEQRKLSEVAEIVGGGTPSTNIPEYWDGDIDWYAPAEINDQIYVDGSERKITKLGLEKSSAKILPADKTVLFTSRAGIGKTAILRRSGATNQGFQSMVLNDETNPYFVFSMSKFIKEEAERVASGSTFAEISGKMLGNLAFMFPTKKEQDKIGEYFSNLDNLITIHQRKCDELKELKKGLLQQMFC